MVMVRSFRCRDDIREAVLRFVSSVSILQSNLPMLMWMISSSHSSRPHFPVRRRRNSLSRLTDSAISDPSYSTSLSCLLCSIHNFLSISISFRFSLRRFTTFPSTGRTISESNPSEGNPLSEARIQKCFSSFARLFHQSLIHALRRTQEMHDHLDKNKSTQAFPTHEWKEKDGTRGTASERRKGLRRCRGITQSQPSRANREYSRTTKAEQTLPLN